MSVRPIRAVVRDAVGVLHHLPRVTGGGRKTTLQGFIEVRVVIPLFLQQVLGDFLGLLEFLGAVQTTLGALGSQERSTYEAGTAGESALRIQLVSARTELAQTETLRQLRNPFTFLEGAVIVQFLAQTAYHSFSHLRGVVRTILSTLSLTFAMLIASRTPTGKVQGFSEACVRCANPPGLTQ